MITLSILPNFKGSKSDWIKAIVTCLLIDSACIIPFANF